MSPKRIGLHRYGTALLQYDLKQDYFLTCPVLNLGKK